MYLFTLHSDGCITLCCYSVVQSDSVSLYLNSILKQTLAFDGTVNFDHLSRHNRTEMRGRNNESRLYLIHVSIVNVLCSNIILC